MFYFLLLSFCTWGAPVTVTSKNLRDLIEKENSKVKAQALEQKAAETRTGFWARSFLPELELKTGQENFKQGTGRTLTQPYYGAEAKINVFNGFQDLREGELRDLEAERRKFKLARIQAQELDKARSSYWQILYLRERQELLNSAIEANHQNLKSAEKRIRSGVATESDRVEFEMKDVDLRRELNHNKVALDLQMRALALQLNLEPSDLLFSERLAHDHDFEALLKHSEKDHEFLYRESEILAEQMRLQSKKNRDSWLPQVDIFAGFNQFNEREKGFPAAEDRAQTVVGVRATMSLDLAFEPQKEAGAKAREAEAARLEAEYAKRETHDVIEGEMKELRFLHDQVHAAEENIKRSEKYYRLTLSEYARGVKNSPDVLGASEKLFEMRHKRIEIVRDFQLAKSHLMSKIQKN